MPTNDYRRLLERSGRDIAGALVIVAEGEDPSAPGQGVAELDEERLADEVSSLDENPLGLHDDGELSLAGVQTKLLLVERLDGGWSRPVHGYPSTHILKVDDVRFPGLVRAEGECLALAHLIGLTPKPPVLERHGGRDCLIVARYDRSIGAGGVRRIHQEGACQALDVPIDADGGRGKYEAFGGPSLRRIAELLRVHARHPQRELESLLRLVVFTVAIGNADLHGKNISLLHDGEGNITLAPAYDTVPSTLWAQLRSSSAVAVDGCVAFDDISAGQMAAEAASWGMGRAHAMEVIADTAEAVRAALPAAVRRDDLHTAIDARVRGLLD